MSGNDKCTKKLLMERREALRFPCKLVATCRPAGAPEGDCQTVSVRNLSPTGLGLIAEAAIAPGTLLAVQFLLRCKGSSWAAQVRVLHVRPEGTAGWYHGCRFMHPLGRSELESLVQ